MVCRCVDQASGYAQNSPIGAVSSSWIMIAKAGQIGLSVWVGRWRAGAFNDGLRSDPASWALYFLALASTMVVTKPVPTS